MGRQKSKNTIEVCEGVYIKKNGSSPKWHYYFALGGHQHRSSTKTTDQAKARKIALDAYDDARERQRTGKVIQKISFKKLTTKYIESLKGIPKEKFHKETLDRHFMEFFGRYDDITKITQGTTHDYLSHRREKSGHKILNQSLNKENAVFNQMMRFAHEHSWISKELRIKRQSEAQSYNRRAHFKLEEYRQLLRVSRKRRDELIGKNVKGQARGLNINKFWQRALLHDIIIVLANTGMRVDEMKTVRWCDIDWKEHTIKLHSAGKTKSSRSLIVRGYGIQALQRIKERRESWLEKETPKALDDKERVQSLPNGTEIKSFKKGFNQLLEECGFNYADKKEKHSMTSLRHTFATLRLTARNGKRASMRGLSRQLGTSQKMIEKHYGHDDVEDYRDEIMG